MGIWSRSAGEIFLDWLAPPLGLRWIDIGCGNGAFTELSVERCGPAEVQGIDPSGEQLAFACTRPALALGKVSPRRCHGPAFRRQQLRCGCDGIGPCVRSRPREGCQRNGSSSRPRRRSCDLHVGHVGGRSPLDPIHSEIQAMGIVPTRPPRMDASRMEALRDWDVGPSS